MNVDPSATHTKLQFSFKMRVVNKIDDAFLTHPHYFLSGKLNVECSTLLIAYSVDGLKRCSYQFRKR